MTYLENTPMKEFNPTKYSFIKETASENLLGTISIFFTLIKKIDHKYGMTYDYHIK